MGSSIRVVFVQRSSDAWSSGTESMKAERIALLECYELGAVLRRNRVTGLTSKTGSLRGSMSAVVSGGRESMVCGIVSL